MQQPSFDIIVVGGGHAGSEAAAAAARMGARTLLITMSLEAIGRMSCNPAIGGIGKGQIAREIDALGGLMGRATDEAGLQFRMLNRSKGPAVWSPRAQCDRFMYAASVRRMLEAEPNLYMRADQAVDLLSDGDRIAGVKTQLGVDITARAVILTSGTFMNGQIHIGERSYGGGRMGEGPSKGLTGALHRLGLESGRLKTGTPPRLDGRTINYGVLEEQKGDAEPVPFSFMTDRLPERQLSCWITYTDQEVHDILRTGFDRSPMFVGRIQGTGPRYCPSIEDKIDRFADKDRHQLFLEPEGWNTDEVYVNGFSTSLPEEVQMEAIRRVPGLESVHMLRPGYAIEYDYFPPYQLRYSLETKAVRGLFFAGQINGTTGYEEAGAQGLVAGVNAVRYLNEAEPMILKRSEAYIGVLIDDLVAKGTEEPYRMFTSRAEYRMMLRQDNADERLTGKAFDLGLVGEDRLRRTEERLAARRSLLSSLHQVSLTPDQVNPFLEELGSAPVRQTDRIAKVALRPEVSLGDLLRRTNNLALIPSLPGLERVEEMVETDLKYEGYVAREQEMIQKMGQLEDLRLPDRIDYRAIQNITMEAREKLDRIRPQNLGQASRISGVSPSDVSVLMVMVRSGRFPSLAG
ncbi:MAG: tRNA uridine-5-carboxymethylaminomethyl(34) synthesis enzyme MnmG [Bacteroidetes bacterium]|nr:tRNA uridine-5-carboxymethylaminomethyl(34) synthesis enzyme MnmG [Bacteroidota bacterium]MDA0874026.1 tRNA uridine-5-carboxymethylaminomethyl(34) synthesis enzyme MnmG [Bacteroidota bacterium]